MDVSVQACAKENNEPYLTMKSSCYALFMFVFVVTFCVLGCLLQHNINEDTPLSLLLSVLLIPYICGAWILSGAGMAIGYFFRSLLVPSLLLAYITTSLGFSVLFISSYESYMVLDEGHVGLNNLFQVSILLVAITALIGIWYDIKMKLRGLSLFNGTILIVGSLFILWLYDIGEAGPRELVPALRSYWLPWHVMANFIGYGAFLVAAGGGVLELMRSYRDKQEKPSMLPSVDDCRSMSLSAVRFGFPIFTLAIILGSLWAYDSWGGYWSWDPKETWALIVWLCYAGYLHAAYTPLSRGKVMPIWAIAGFFITLFCYLGVNMFLDGLHSYGQLG